MKGCCNTHTSPFVLFDHLRFKAFLESCLGSLLCVNSRGQHLLPMLILQHRKVSPCVTFSTTGRGRASCTFSCWFFHVGCGWLRGLLQTHQADRAKMSRSVFGAAKLSGTSLRALGRIIVGHSALVGCVLHPCFCLCWSVSVLVCNIVCRVWG